MATPQVSGGNGVSVISDLAALLGGQKTSTTGSANTSLIGQLAPQLMSPADPTAIIQQLFSAAQGQLPALQAARANAVGARSGRNSSVVNATDKLQQDTILKAQAQIAQQEMQRQQTAAQLAASLAQATRGTTTQQGTNLGRAAGVLGLLQAGSKFADSSLGKKAGSLIDTGMDKFSTMFTADSAGMANSGADLSGTMQFGGDTPQVFGAFDAGTLGATASSDFGSSADFGSAAGSADYGSFIADEGMADYADEFASFIGLADGGLIGRDDVAQRKIMQQYKPKGYADGGVVTQRTPGGRRSSAPAYTPDAIQRTTAMRNPLSIGAGLGGIGTDASAGSSDSTAPATQESLPSLSQAIAMGQIAVALASQNPISLVSAINNMMNATASANPSTPSPEADTIMGVSSIDTDAMDAVNASLAADAAAGSSGIGANVGGNSGEGQGEGAAPGDAGGGVGDSVGDGSGGGDGGPGDFADGGHISGKGSGISDSIGIKVSKGEYVVPADVVAKMGTDFFDNLRAQFHVPAAMQALDTDDEDGDDVG